MSRIKRVFWSRLQVDRLSFKKFSSPVVEHILKDRLFMQALQPQISELLRTCVHPPTLVLRVAHIKITTIRRDQPDISTSAQTDEEELQSHELRGFTVRLLLTDGELTLQALIHRKFQGLKDVTSVEQGDLVEIRRFQVKRAARTNGRGKVVFLGIQDCTFLLQPTKKALEESIGAQGSVLQHLVPKKRERDEDGSHDGEQEFDVLGKDLAAVLFRSSPPKRGRTMDASTVQDLPESLPVSPLSSFSEINDLSPPKGAQTPTRASKALSLPAEHGSVTSSIQKKSRTRVLNSTFGARNIIPDDEDDEEDFFEPIQAIRTPAKVSRAALHEVNPNASAKLEQGASKSPPDLDGPIVFGNGEPRLPPQQVSRRDGIYALSQSLSSHTASASLRAIVPPPAEVEIQQPAHLKPKVHLPNQTQTQQHRLLPSPPFHTLDALRNSPSTQPLPTKNYTLTTLAVVSWLGTSLIHRTGSPFPPKRHLKIVDPSISTLPPDTHPVLPSAGPATATVFRPHSNFHGAVTVAVYIDAADFKPPAGTIALFRGVVMQRLGNGDVILNAYARLKEQKFADNDVGAVVEEDGESRDLQGNAMSEGEGGGFVNGIGLGIGTGAGTGAGPRDAFSHWFITDPVKIRALGYGSQLDYYTEWWNNRRREQ